MMNGMIHVENLTKVYRSFKGAKEVRALERVNLTVSEGEFIGIMGPSGSGKTTLLNILSGVDTATSGKVMIDGKSQPAKETISNMAYVHKHCQILYLESCSKE